MNTTNVPRNCSTLTEYGWLRSGKYTHLTKATSLQGALTIAVKTFLRRPENGPMILKEDGTPNFPVILQNWVNDYGVTVFENMESDGYTLEEMPKIISREEVADHIVNLLGWICIDHKSAPHTDVYNEMIVLMNRYQITDYTK